MKHLIAILSLAPLLASAAALAQSPPPLPALTQQQTEDVRVRMDAYRRETDARVARGEITADEADRLLQWREWQVARQAANPAAPGASSRAPVDTRVPPDYYGSSPRGDSGSPPPDYYVIEPPPLYVPYQRYVMPRYWGPAPYAYWGPAVCAGGFGRHFGGRICF
jgi:hypothetical protein